MKDVKLLITLGVMAAICSGAVAKEGLPFTVDNRLRFEWDDNIRQQSDENDTGSWKIIEELQLIGDVNAENTYASLRYQPSYVYWDKEPGDRANLHHQADFILDHEFSSRVSLGLKDTFRYADLPELRASEDSDLVIRQDNTYTYNKVNGDLSYRMLPELKLRPKASYSTLTYDENDVARRDDRDVASAGLDLEKIFTQQTTAAGQVRYSVIDYTESPQRVDANGQVIDRGRGDRGANTTQVGGMLRHIFSPQLIGNVRAGYSHKSFEAAHNDGQDAPYGDASVTFLPSPQTRVTLGGTHMLYEADVYPYVSQTRSTLYGSVGQDITGKIDLFVSGAHIAGDYDAEDVVETVRFDESEFGGTDESTQVSSRLRYNFYRKNYLELGYQYTSISSDVRRDYERNRYWLGWQTRL